MTSRDGPKRQLFQQFAAVAKAAAHAHRLELLEAMAQGERSVDVLAERAGLSVANASHHLQQMRRGGLIEARREGKYVFYGLADPAVLNLLGALAEIAERNIAEVREIVRSYLSDRDGMEAVPREQLLERMKKGLVTVLDVRPEDEFALGHLHGAINVPLDTLKRYVRWLDKSLEVIAYCRGAYCVLSFEAVAELRARGFRVRRLEDGFPEWKAAGLPVETGVN